MARDAEGARRSVWSNGEPTRPTGRSLLVGPTPEGLARLRVAQVTHHAVVRRLLLDRLDKRDLRQMGELWEKATPGSVSSPVWPL